MRIDSVAQLLARILRLLSWLLTLGRHSPAFEKAVVMRLWELIGQCLTEKIQNSVTDQSWNPRELLIRWPGGQLCLSRQGDGHIHIYQSCPPEKGELFEIYPLIRADGSFEEESIREIADTLIQYEETLCSESLS